MLTLESVTSASGGTKYYCQTTCHYSLDREQTSQYKKWYGNAAKELGLSGDVKDSEFKKILEGKIEHNNEKFHLGNRKQGEIEHSPGRDLTFAAPKSVSLQHNLEGGDKRIKNALIKAAENTLEYVQDNFVYTRVKQDGKVSLEKTDNIAAALFYENLNRDKEFHDHVHCVVANLTQRKDGAWRSTELRRIFDNQIHIGKVFRMELAFNLRSLGYDLEVSDKENYFFEIKGFDKKLSENFSERTQNILIKAKELNRDLNVKVRQLANFLTRNPDKKITSSDLKTLTDNKIENYIKETGKTNVLDNIAQRTLAAKNRIVSTASSSGARKAVGYAIEHLSERKTVFNEKDIIDIAKEGNLGHINLRAINKEVAYLIKKEFILQGSGKYAENEGKICYATRHSLEREKAIISILQDGKGIYKSIVSARKADDLLHDTSLNKGQQDAAKLILTSKDRISAIQGFAGTGKTYMLSKLKETLNSINKEQLFKNPKHIHYQLLGLAPSGAAVKELQKALGPDNARTLQGFLAQYDGYANGRGTLKGKKDIRNEFRNKLLLVDEGSMISSTQMKDLATITSILDVKMVLVGDTRQLLAVEGGNPFYEMQREGMKTVTMTENIRQETKEGKAISYSAYARDFTNVFEKIGTNLIDCTTLLKAENQIKIERGELKEENASDKVSNSDTAFAAARLYISFDKEKRSNTLMLGQSNQTKDLVNSFIREVLIDKNELGNKSSTIETLINKNLTIAQRGESFNYKAGDVILFNKGNRNLNIEKNEYFKIKNINSNLLNLESLSADKKEIIFNSSLSKSYRKSVEVYKTEEREFRAEDQVMFTRKIESKDSPIVNSTLGIIKAIKESSYIIEVEGNEAEFPKDSSALKHMDYSYCRTTHKGQGATTKTAILITESWWEHLTNQRNMLVQATRQKEEIFLVVDNKEKVIKKIVENKGDREGSIEFTETNQVSLIKKEKLKEQLFQALGGSEEYAKYKIALEESRVFNNNIKNRNTPAILAESKIDPELTKSDNINKNPTALATILNLQDKSIQKLEKNIEKNKEKELQETASSSKSTSHKNNKVINKTEKPNKKSTTKFIVPEFSNHELSQRWEEAITSHFTNSDLKNLTGAIEKGFANNGSKIRFGNKNTCELIWYGKAGYVRDYKTDDDLKWGEGNIKLSHEEKSRLSYKVISEEGLKNLKIEAQNKQKEVDLSKKLKNLEAAKRANKIFSSIPEGNKENNKNHPYLTKKNISNISNLGGVKFTKDNRLVIPVKDTKGNIHSLQYINKDGTKLFLKDGVKIGNFFLLGQNKIEDSKKIFIAEGFATAASVHLATKHPVALCFDSGNIEQTLQNLKEKYPNKSFVVVGDDDKYTYIKGKQVNSGMDKAVAAAEKHGVSVVFPEFKSKDVDKFKQQDAKGKGPTDFNDLHKLEGIKSVQTQLSNENNYHNSIQHNVPKNNETQHYSSQIQHER